MAFLKGKNHELIMKADDALANEIKDLVAKGEISQEELDKKVEEWHEKNGTDPKEAYSEDKEDEE